MTVGFPVLRRLCTACTEWVEPSTLRRFRLSLRLVPSGLFHLEGSAVGCQGCRPSNSSKRNNPP